jgi:TetR/AcrR family fatty acid metabolism transcriptional regulator
MEKKELLRKEAINIFAQEGFHSTTVKMIAKEAGVAVGTVYNYFSNKNEVLNYIFEVEFNNKINLLENIKEKDIALRNKLVMFLNRHFTNLKDNPNLATVLIQESGMPRKYCLEAVNNFKNELPKIFAEMIDEAKAKGEIREVESKLIANAIFRTVRGIAITVVEDESYSFAEAKRELINFFWLGLGK